MMNCKECGKQISPNAKACPNCGAPVKRARGFEYKDKTTFLGLPLIHISFKYTAEGRPVPAIGVVSIGQFGMGIVNISQFGIGVVSISQFTISAYALAQFAIAYDLIAQIGLYFNYGRGQIVWSIPEIISML